MQVKVPALIEILFENECLDNTRILFILNSFQKNKNGISMDALAYYYSLLISEYAKEENELIRYNISNLYINFKNRSRNKILNLIDRGYIEIKGNLINDFSELDVRITSEGKEYIKSLNNDYFIALKDRMSIIKKEYKYSNKQKGKILNGE